MLPHPLAIEIETWGLFANKGPLVLEATEILGALVIDGIIVNITFSRQVYLWTDDVKETPRPTYG